MKNLLRWLICAGLALPLASCTSFEKRRGLSPVLDATEIASASDNKVAILRALARDANVPIMAGSEISLAASSDWYRVADAGFNFVDDQCRAYFRELFFLDRGREQLKTGIASAGQTAAAIMAATGASTVSLAILAQAIGFGVNATELLAGTYLYQLPPAPTYSFVEKLQLAFRDAAAHRRAAINTPETAYYMIQRYLDLCLPPRIEAEITKQISSTTAVPVPQGGGVFFKLETVSATRDAAVVLERNSNIGRGNRTDGREPGSGRGTALPNRSPEDQCALGDGICIRLTRYLMPTGTLRTDRLRQFSDELSKTDKRLENRVFSVIRNSSNTKLREDLIRVMETYPSP